MSRKGSRLVVFSAVSVCLALSSNVTLANEHYRNRCTQHHFGQFPNGRSLSISARWSTQNTTISIPQSHRMG